MKNIVEYKTKGTYQSKSGPENPQDFSDNLRHQRVHQNAFKCQTHPFHNMWIFYAKWWTEITFKKREDK